jgi:N-acetylneuraminate synthase
MEKYVEIGERKVGNGFPVFIIAEIGINHNGDIDITKKLIDTAIFSGCDAVKFQKRTPEICVFDNQKNIKRETPWGVMTYIEYRKRTEFGETEYSVIDQYCKENNIIWFASCWDKPSVDFIDKFDPVCYKIASASLTDDELLKYIRDKDRPIIVSTGMSTMEQIQHAVSILNQDKLLLAHSTSSYPCKPEELNLKVIKALKRKFDVPIGYSGHEVGLPTTYAAASLGACFIERHITLDRTMWGSDQAASLEPSALIRMVKDIRIIEKALGDGIKRVYDSEKPLIKKLRKN